MEALFAGITWVALVLGMTFVFWKVYLVITWNIERFVFLGSVSHYLKNEPKDRKKNHGTAK